MGERFYALFVTDVCYVLKLSATNTLFKRTAKGRTLVRHYAFVFCFKRFNSLPNQLGSELGQCRVGTNPVELGG